MSKTKTHVIDARRCKSCGLCVDACPKGVLAIGTEINGQGYNYIERAHPEKWDCIMIMIETYGLSRKEMHQVLILLSKVMCVSPVL